MTQQEERDEIIRNAEEAYRKGEITEEQLLQIRYQTRIVE
jgi:outer membrane protein TolC